MNTKTFSQGVFLRKYGKLIILLAVALMITACGSGTNETQQGNQIEFDQNWIELDPVFRAYYAHLGGKEILGEVISLMQEEGHIKVQYVEAGKLTLDPTAPKEEMLRFAPLGRDMGVTDPPSPPPTQPGPYHDGQHFIHPDFIPLYEQLGAEVFGPALSEVHYNPVRKRYEQYFENLGIYRLEGTDEIHLLAYGLWDCADDCQAPPNSGSSIIDFRNHAAEVFLAYHNWAGDLLGFALSGAYINKYGAWEQVFENGVLVSGAGEKSSQVFLLPLATKLNVPVDAPREMDFSQKGYYSEVKDGKGYIIPTHLWEYIASHGGLSIFGAPITHYAQAKPNLFRQCFANLCLNYSPSASESVRIRPEPLGYVYQLLFAKEAPTVAPAPAPKNVTTLKVWERHPALASDQQQVVGISVLSNFVPVEDVLAELILFMPEGKPTNFNFQPTDAKGQAHIELPFVIASNGTLVEYQVCVPLQSGDKFCVGESFIIWNNP